MEEPTMRFALRKTLPTLGVLFLFVFVADCLAGQISASFGVPLVGYVLDVDAHSIRPITGIPGSSHIADPLKLGFPVASVDFLPDERHAVVDSPEFPSILVVDLAAISHSVIAGAPSSVSAMRTSFDGTKAALYYASGDRLVIVSGLPNAPVIQSSIDLSSKPPLTRFAVSNDGATVLLSFRGDETDDLFRWTRSGGLSLLTTRSRIADILFVGDDAVFADSTSKDVVLLQNIREQISQTVIVDGSDEAFQPLVLSLSSRNEIYIGTPDSVFVVDGSNYNLRKLSCNCNLTTITRMHDAAFRLTDELHQPVIILDARSSPERILFVPALSVDTLEVLP